ncbi:MAG TPA: hypothetical protein VF271_06205 [Rhodanobacteraceae bacterium]
MMRVAASAPGKLVMTGDYAVLEGAPALVMAVNRRARVEVESTTDDAFLVNAPDLAIHAARGRLCGDAVQWETDTATADQLRLVTAVVEYLARHGHKQVAADMRLDTHAFFDADAHAKLGLGSSAALTVALTAALETLAGNPMPDVAGMIAMHRQMQGGRGSGLDIATSLLGGTVLYRLQDDEPQAERVAWPERLGVCCVWSGQSASTGDALAHLAQWRLLHARDYGRFMRSLTDTAQAVANAVRAGDATSAESGMGVYGAMLASFGKAAGIDIVSAPHRQLQALAKACGAAYKTCGAGGGDVGAALSTDKDRLAQFAHEARAAGFHVLDLGLGDAGLVVEQAIEVTGETRGQRTQA